MIEQKEANLSEKRGKNKGIERRYAVSMRRGGYLATMRGFNLKQPD
jgi:hypothetical protein